MWIPKSKEELEKSSSNTITIKGILFGAGIIYIVYLFKLIFHNLIEHGEFKVDRATLCLAFIVPIVIILFYNFIALFHKNDNLKDGIKYNNSTVVCIKCNKVKTFDNIEKCNCGGSFELLSKMKWID